MHFKIAITKTKTKTKTKKTYKHTNKQTNKIKKKQLCLGGLYQFLNHKENYFVFYERVKLTIVSSC